MFFYTDNIAGIVQEDDFHQEAVVGGFGFLRYLDLFQNNGYWVRNKKHFPRL